jgi:cytochrome P450
VTDTNLSAQTAADPLAIPAVGPPCYIPGAGWIVTRNSHARAVLADPGYEVPVASAGGPTGSIGWLRSSGCRFSNGYEHARRRAHVVAELDELPVGVLHVDAERRAHAVIDAAGSAGRVDVMASLARRVPMAVLAASLGAANAEHAAEAVCVAAAGYFPGAGATRERAADAAVAGLVGALGPADEQTIVAKITLLVQACDATAALIGNAVTWVLPPAAGERLSWPTDAVLAEVVRYDPPLRVTRRISRRDALLAGCIVPAGSAVAMRVDAGNRDPEVFPEPAEFRPGRTANASLTFGSGLRPCPGKEHAMMLASGVVQAVRDRCAAVIGPVEYEPSAALRIPARVQVSVK